MVMEDLQDYLMIKAMSAKSKLAFRKCSGLRDIDIVMEFETRPDQEQTEGEGDKNAAASAAGEPKPVSVYKMNMHCEGCCKKIRRAVKHLEGVESAKTYRQSNKLTVTGEVDPEKVKARLEKKMRKEVEIVSLEPKKDGHGGVEKKADEKAAEKKPEVKKPPTQITVVLKIRTHCDGCITKMKKIIRKIKGVESVTVDDRKDLVTVKGTMEVKDLVPYLSEKFRTSVEVIQPKTDEAKKEVGGGSGGRDEKKTDAKKVDGGGEKKRDDNKEGSKAGKKKSDGKKDQAGAGEKKNDDKKGDERGEEAKVKNKEAPAPAPVPVPDPATATAPSGHGDAMAEVINKMDNYPAYVPPHWMDGIFSQTYTVDPQHPQYGYGYNPINQGYQTPVYNYGYIQQRYGQQGYYIEPAYNHPFSDDNPHACSIM
ncbi:heavy metal-associated isoprenylated plant protein 5-like [Euphorbia lathyris]|uniref:heavy metal-associated isoprenylated plant protein 5-like n=1 Tax=Euphorbia lathyris TaxID=212925 RepID=UPI003313CC67